MRSVSNANTLRAIVLSSLMILMTQAGFLDSLNAWSAEEETLDQTNDVLETGGSGASNFTASVEGADLIIDEAMTNITFQYNDTEAYNGNGTAWMVKDIYSGSTGSSPAYLTAVGNTLFFRANYGTNGTELWKSDGTANGTVMVKDIYSGSSSSSPDYLTAVGNTLFFVADDGTNGKELWKSDGTASGTVMVKDIRSGSTGSEPTYLTAIGNTLYFYANDGTNGTELWKSDGTASGTVMVKDIRSGSYSSTPLHLTAIGNTLYFSADDGNNGRELWKSDGTTNGTVMVKDISSGSGPGSPSGFTALAHPSISEHTTQPTESNCGRVTEQPMAP